MLEQKNRFDTMRVYACRCPSCKRFMNVPGITLNDEKYIKCWNCGARSRIERWIGGSYVNSNRRSNGEIQGNS